MNDHALPIAVIGAGPAGLFAAERLTEAGHRVRVHERMPSVARKLLMAGRGGLNLTHSEELEPFLARYGEARPWLEGAIRAFPPQALRDWAEGLGQETFTGSSGRVFPRAMKASPLLRAWLARLAGLGVEIRTRERFLGWDGDALRFETPAGERRDEAAAAILALGGASWPRLGSDAAWVPTLGLPMEPFKPANMGFTCAWTPFFRENFAGQPLKRIALRFGDQQRRGEAMITAEGIEGGAIYALAAPLREAILAKGEVILIIDLRPDLSLEALAERLAAPRRGQSLSSFLKRAASLPPVAIALLREAGAPPEAAVALAGLIKEFPLRLTGLAPIERAISSAGGVRREGLDEHLMLKERPGTFLAGEMLDWEAPTGGYLLQACFATAALAAEGASRWVTRRQL
ncbi:TIGR03862 family flavoprotein [Acetobacteraceae bacterium H6797]|nr:TIGR03862 family flavoprotein [Acetobacteraceae bacterium H6797]